MSSSSSSSEMRGVGGWDIINGERVKVREEKAKTQVEDVKIGRLARHRER